MSASGQVPTGTVPPHVTRLVLRAGQAAGLDRNRLAGVAGLASLQDNAVRLPSASLVRIWEEWSAELRDLGGGSLPWRLWRPGSLGVWDYLFTSAGTLAEAFEHGNSHAATITDPAESFTPVRDGASLTVSFHCQFADHPVFPIIAEFAVGMILTAAVSGAGRPLTPVRVTLPGPAPNRHGDLAEAYGTRSVEFCADVPSVTFSAADADRPLPRADPVLAAILRDHARTTLAASRAVLSWLDRFRGEVGLSLTRGAPDLARVAHELGMSPRTVQRRLHEEGTSWRAELERARQRRVEQLLKTTLTLESIAARVGYADPRSLRRAIHRWYGHGPANLRRDRPDPTPREGLSTAPHS
ncbi:AraC family transcriptional regulator [Streptomyces sp. N2-109]|uniref:AraC family transcriptional regulator n=1 Tax=Streptomyces gossypii TaxID=2883101 RepID=A0ABT2JQK7_9ACTN|nr:AraC family transcriptional regulator [Streptomyces gossypii]MCT2589645.1 AraC family transcriptional regulator [Streptomyces gossypii]